MGHGDRRAQQGESEQGCLRHEGAEGLSGASGEHKSAAHTIEKECEPARETCVGLYPTSVLLVKFEGEQRKKKEKKEEESTQNPAHAAIGGSGMAADAALACKASARWRARRRRSAV